MKKSLIIGSIILVIVIVFLFLFVKTILVPCSKEGKICPDGSGVGRAGPNCKFKECPAIIYCESQNQCSANSKCVKFEDEDRAYCYADDPCFKCLSQRKECTLSESYPIQVKCT